MSESDPEAFYRREYQPQLRRAYLLLGDLATAQDAVHDAFAAVLGRWHSIDEPGPYLNRCVLGDLNFNARSALVLRYFEGQTEREIADHLGLQPGSIGPMITRSLRTLNEKVALGK